MRISIYIAQNNDSNSGIMVCVYLHLDKKDEVPV